MKKILVLLIALLILGCAGEKGGQDVDNQQTDLKTQIAVFKNNNLWKAQITFTLPNPCHEVQFLGKEITGQKISLNYKHIPPEPDTPCAQVIKTYNETIDLGELDKGNYTVLVKVNNHEADRLDFSVQDE